MLRQFRVQLTEENATRKAIVAATRARIAAEAERSLAVLKELAASAKSKNVRDRARRSLDRYRTGG